MNLYVWSGPEITGSGSNDAFLVVAASTLDEARNLFLPFLEPLSSGDDWKELKRLNKNVAAASRWLGPPSEDFPYEVDWKTIFEMSPRVLPLEGPMIVAYHYGHTE